MGGSFFYSILLHVIVFALLLIQFPAWDAQRRETVSAPIMIDLRQVEISEKTNLPPLKTVQKPKKIQAPKPKPAPPKEKKAIQEAPKPKPQPKPKNAVEAKSSKVKMDTKPKPQPKVKPASKPAVKSKENTKSTSQETNDLDSLLASVEKISQKIPEPSLDDIVDTVTREGTKNGIKGGVSGSLTQKLSISEIDFIRSTVQKHWNIDPGAEGMHDMRIEIKVSVDKSGHVWDVKIMDQKRFQTDPAFRSAAESARRAIYICDKLGSESPFQIIASKHPDSYEHWKDMTFTFNPLEGNVS